MLCKIINGVPVEPPINHTLEDGTTVCGFNLVADQYGYKHLITEEKPAYDARFQKLTTIYSETDTNNVESFIVEEIMPLEDYKTNRVKWFDNFCNEEIMKGFNSVGYKFRFNHEDQANFAQQTLLVLVHPDQHAEIPWKTEDAGVVVLTKEQYMTVLNDAQNHKLSFIQHYWRVKSLILNAQDHRQVANITWIDGTLV